MVEHPAVNRAVVGSSPTSPAIQTEPFGGIPRGHLTATDPICSWGRSSAENGGSQM